VCVCACVCTVIISFTINDVFISVCIIWMCELIKRQVHMCAYLDDTCILVLKVHYVLKIYIYIYIYIYMQVFS